MRKSSLLFLCLFIQALVLAGFLTHAAYKRDGDAGRLQENASFVQKLGLTDLCLFTEASYTRHLSLADFHTPFQDSPMALEHFPSASLVAHPSVSMKNYD
jgi:hypothetical protein